MKYVLVTIPLVARMSHKTIQAKVFFIYDQNYRESSGNLTLEYWRNSFYKNVCNRE